MTVYALRHGYANKIDVLLIAAPKAPEKAAHGTQIWTTRSELLASFLTAVLSLHRVGRVKHLV